MHPVSAFFVVHHITEGFVNSAWVIPSLHLCIYSTLYIPLLLHYCNSKQVCLDHYEHLRDRGLTSLLCLQNFAECLAHGSSQQNIFWLNKTINKSLICQTKLISLLRNFYFLRQYKKYKKQPVVSPQHVRVYVLSRSVVSDSLRPYRL